MPDRRDVAHEARKLVDVKWQHQGRTEHGVDCIGLVVLAVTAAGFEIEDYRADYARRADGKELMAALRARFEEIDAADLAPGDIVCLRDAGRPAHLGVIAEGRKGGLNIIHAAVVFGAVKESGFRGRLRDDLETAFRVPGGD